MLVFSDIDECKLGLSTCSLDAECTNTLGSFSCQCKVGFSGDGRTCVGRRSYFILHFSELFGVREPIFFGLLLLYALKCS